MQSSIDPPAVAERLTGEQLAVLLAALEVLLAEQRDRLERSEELFGDLSADSSVDGSARQAARAAAEEALAGISRLEEAVRAIDDGTYGSCRSCARPIPFERLEAIPDTRHCVACPGD